MRPGIVAGRLCAIAVAASWLAPMARASDDATLEQRVEAFFDGLQAAVHAGDVDAAVAHFDPDVLVFHPGEEQTRGTAVLRQGLEALLATHSMRMRDELVEVQDLGGHVLAIGHYWHEITPADDSGPVELTGRFLVILRPGPDGRWRIWRDMDQAAPASVTRRAVEAAPGP